MSDSNLAQLRPSTLREQARAALRASIITGEIASGQLYTVGSVAERLGVSATPIREALADLGHNGLVVVVRNRGFIVPEVTEHDLDEIFNLRLLLEVPSVERVAGRLSAEDIVICKYEVERGKRAAVAGDLPGFLEADREFHLRLLSSLGNARLVQMVDNLRDQSRPYRLTGLLATGELVDSAQEHERLIAAVEVGDAHAAGAQMTLHLNNTRAAWAGSSEESDEGTTSLD
jgi:DNA-binding GntR family transcriptional regulator